MNTKMRGINRGSFSLNLFFLIIMITTGLVTIFYSMF
jgi:hypothetical protein